ncbi:hypothetical protein HDU79_007320, partial [Rhizoclosmatium sp. JEL0117]
MFGQSSKAEFTGVIGHIGVVKLKEHNIVLNEPCAMFIDRDKKQIVSTFKVSEEVAAVQVSTFNDPTPVEGDEYRPYADLPKESTRLADIMESWGLPKNIEMMMRKSFRISPAAIYDLPDLQTYHKGRVLIIGDAAHGMVPNSGLGLLTGLEDVGVLLELFRNFPESKDLLKVLNLYSKLRVPRGHDAAKRSRDMAKQYYEGSQTIGHILLRFGIFLFNYNIATLYKAYDCPTEVAAAIKAIHEASKPAANRQGNALRKINGVVEINCGDQQQENISPLKQMHALIVGSGLVGAATAIALSQVGIESTLYDQVDLVQAALNSGGAPVAVDFGDSGGSVVLAASGLRVLRTLGLLDEVMAASLPSKTTYWFKIDGSAPIALDAANVNRKAGETDPALQPPVQILRSKLHSILMQACHKAGVRCFTGKKLSGVVEEEQGVTAKFADGSSATGDFLIGAD